MLPLAYFTSLGDNAGFIKRHNSQKRYGKATMIPPIMAMLMADMNGPLTVLPCNGIFTGGMHNAWPRPSLWLQLHKAEYVMNEGLAGA